MYTNTIHALKHIIYESSQIIDWKAIDVNHGKIYYNLW